MSQPHYRLGRYESELLRRRSINWGLSWLETQPGDSWESRWILSGADAAGWEWIKLVEQWLRPNSAASGTCQAW